MKKYKPAAFQHIFQTSQKLDKLPVNLIRYLTEFLTFHDVCCSLVRANKQLQHHMQNNAVYQVVVLRGRETMYIQEVMRWLTSIPKRCSRIRSIQMSIQLERKHLIKLLQLCKTHQGRSPLVINRDKPANYGCLDSGWMSIDAQSNHIKWSRMKSWVVQETTNMSLPTEELVSNLHELTFYSDRTSGLDFQFVQKYCQASLQCLHFVGVHSNKFPLTLRLLLANAVNLTTLQISCVALSVDELQRSLPKRLHSLYLSDVYLWPAEAPQIVGGHSPNLHTLSLKSVQLRGGLEFSQLTRQWPKISSFYFETFRKQEGSILDLTGWKHLERFASGFFDETMKLVFAPDICLRVVRSRHARTLDHLIRAHRNTLLEVHVLAHLTNHLDLMTVLGNQLRCLSIPNASVTLKEICSLATQPFASNLEELQLGQISSHFKEKSVVQEFNQVFEKSFPKLVRLYIPAKYKARIRFQRPFISFFSVW